MKRLFLLLVAAGLVALGVLGDRYFRPAGTTATAPTAAVPTATPATRTTSYTPAATTVSQASIDAATEHAYAVAAPAIVYVVNPTVGTGSGVIYDSKGDIVTNYHVVKGGSNFSVTLNNGHVYTAKLVGSDPVDDLAVIRISASNLTPAHFAAAGDYSVAQSVLAVGSPLGLKQSVAFGLISGLHRVEQEPNGAYLPDALQTSAPINPGNSGGALVTLAGVVVGIPTLQQTSASDGTTAQNIGFAIPSERVTLVANQIIKTGKVEHTDRAFLGIVPTDSTAAQSQSPFGTFGPPTTNVAGALVSELSPSGPAAKAGIQQSDVIVEADGNSITNSTDLLTVLAGKKPGSTLNLKINRSGSTMNFQVRLGELPA
jgi:S1-C subfamily serine protease